MEKAQLQLPDIDSEYKLTAEQINNFREDGHILIRQLLNNKEAALYHDVIVEAALKYNTEKRALSERDTYGKAFLQIMNLWRNDADVKKFVFSKRFAKVAAELLGVSNVRLYHDQALFKEAGGGPTPWHQDQYYWPIDTSNTITMWMPLVDINIEMGMLSFATGSHKKGLVFDYEISDESSNAYDKYVSENKYPISVASVMKAGDATFHYGHTIHNAPGNASSIMRQVMTIIYVADGGRITKPRHKYQENDLKTWMMNKPVGSLIDSELNPRLL